MAETALGLVRCPACGATWLGCWPVTVDGTAFLCEWFGTEPRAANPFNHLYGPQ